MSGNLENPVITGMPKAHYSRKTEQNSYFSGLQFTLNLFLMILNQTDFAKNNIGGSLASLRRQVLRLKDFKDLKKKKISLTAHTITKIILFTQSSNPTSRIFLADLVQEIIFLFFQQKSLIKIKARSEVFMIEYTGCKIFPFFFPNWIAMRTLM